MAFTGFDQHPGVHQQRIDDAAAVEGDFVFELGHALNNDARLDIGDYHEVKQTLVFSVGSELVRPVLIVKPPPDRPASVCWEVTVRLNGTVVYTRELHDPPPTTFRLDDIAIPLNEALGPPATDEISFRLELVAA
jgi:hypothetical protein